MELLRVRSLSPARLTPTRAFWVTRVGSQAAKALFFGALFLDGVDSSASAFSGVVVAMLLASIVLALPAGALVDRIGPRSGLTLGGLLRAAAITTAFVALGHPQQLWIVAFLYSAASQVYSSSEMALVRELQPRKPGRGHASLLGLQYAGQGAAILLLAPLLYLAAAEAGLLVGSLALFVPVLAASLVIRKGARPHAVDADSPRRESSDRPSAGLHGPDLACGLRLIGREPRVGYAMGVLAFADLATRGLIVALPLFLRDALALDSIGVGAVIAVVAVGVLTGVTWAAVYATGRGAEAVMRVTLVSAVVAISGVAVAGPTALGLALAVPSFAMLGVCFGLAPIAARTVLSTSAPLGEQGRLFATQAAVTDLVVVIPLVFVGVGTEMLGPRSALLLVATIGVFVLPALELMTFVRRPTVPVPMPVAVAVTTRDAERTAAA